MKKFTFKMFTMACFIFIAGYSNAQFKFTSNTNIGQTLTTDSVNGTSTFVVDFSTSKDSSFWQYTDAGDTTFTITLAKCQTQKGLQVNIYDADTVGAGKVINGDFECRDYGGNRNPVRVASIASLMEILGKYEMKNAGTGDSVKNVTWKPSACLFDLDTTGSNQAFGAHPGMYKVVEYGFQFSFSGVSVAESDVTFDIDTYDEGNTGQTASYTLKVGIGGTSDLIEVPDFYVTGSGKKSVSLAAAIGKSASDFDNKKVYIFLKTSGTGTEMTAGNVDPTIVFDNFNVTYQLPQWITPAVGIAGNSIVDNMDNPLEGNLNEETTFGILLQTKDRIGPLTIVNDLQDNTVQHFTFLDTMAIMANDGSGNYNVNVDYTFTPGVFDSGTMTWSKAKIEVAAPDSGTVDDDVMFYFKATPTSMDVMSSRLELNCGTRIWYDVYFKGVEASTAREWNISTEAFNALGDVAETATVEGLTIFAASDKLVTVDANNKSLNGMDFTHRLKLGGSGAFDENGLPVNRVISFDVTGNTKITVYAMSSSGSADRILNIAVGHKDSIIGEFPALGASLTEGIYEYVGDSTKIFMYSPSSGVNIYYIKAEPLTTAINPIDFEKSEVSVYPNPARDYAKVRFTMSEPAMVSLALYNMAGQKIEISTRQQLNAGVNEITINTRSLREGMYVYMLHAGNKVFKGKLNISK